MPDAESNLRAAERVVSLLAANGVPAVVIGAVALAAHRYVRHTEDIDLGVDADLSQMRAIAAALREGGFEAELHEPDDFSSQPSTRLPLPFPDRAVRGSIGEDSYPVPLATPPQISSGCRCGPCIVCARRRAFSYELPWWGNTPW